MDASTKLILGIKDASDSEIEAAELSLKELANEFLKEGKRREFGWTQSVNARFACDYIGAEWEAFTKVEQAVSMHLLSNASQFRQLLEKTTLKGESATILKPKASEWQ